MERGSVLQPQGQSQERRNTDPQAANRQPATATVATGECYRQNPDSIITEPGSGAANPVEVARHGELNDMREELAGQQVETEEPRLQAATTNESPASPAIASHTEDTPADSILHGFETVNTPQETPTPTSGNDASPINHRAQAVNNSQDASASDNHASPIIDSAEAVNIPQAAPALDNDTSPINHPPEPVNIPPQAPPPDEARSLSGDCPICAEDILDGGDLVCCQAQCAQYFHRRCMRSYFRRTGDTRCPYW